LFSCQGKESRLLDFPNDIAVTISWKPVVNAKQYQEKDLESIFRSLRYELGLRPVCHKIADRVSEHLFITVLVCHLVYTIRYQIKVIRYKYQLGQLETQIHNINYSERYQYSKAEII